MTASLTDRIHAAMDQREITPRDLCNALHRTYANGSKIMNKMNSPEQGLHVSEVASICAVLDIPLEWAFEGGDTPVPPRLSPVEHLHIGLLASSLNFKQRTQLLRTTLAIAVVCAMTASVIGGYLVVVGGTTWNLLTGVSALFTALVAAILIGHAWSRYSPSTMAAQEAALNEQLADLTTQMEHLFDRSTSTDKE